MKNAPIDLKFGQNMYWGKIRVDKKVMFFANYWNFRELKTELQPQRPGGGGVRPDPSGGWGPARSPTIFLFSLSEKSQKIMILHGC